MNITEEKEHIYSLMRDVTLERRKLTELYFSLKERLDDLNKIEQRGLTDLSLKGYVDLYNKNQKEDAQVAIRNVERETQHTIRKIEREDRKREEEVSATKDEPKFKKEIQEDKNNNRTKANNSRISLEYMISIISNILRDNGAPMAVADLHEAVNEKLDDAITMKNFNNNIMYRISKKDTKIERATRGFYQYRL